MQTEFRTWALFVATAVFGACGGSSDEPATDAVARPDFRGGTVYEIFVRSFADSNGDGIGDLQGLTAHLDYLNDGKPETTTDLGVDAIWLMPIFPSPSYHGYDVSDYRGINPQYGTMADFDAFLAAAHARGISVLLDYVVNHSSTQHPWFIDASAGPTAAKRDWYIWSDTDPNWPKPFDNTSSSWSQRNGAFYYSLFCGCMPDLNLTNPAVEGEMNDAMKFWLQKGVDGFRLDAVRYYVENGRNMVQDIPETHAYLKRMRAALQAAAPRMILVAEAWAGIDTQAAYYGTGDEVQLAFSFALSDAIKASAGSGDAAEVINMMARSEPLLGDHRGFEAPFLSNHDQVRVLRMLENDRPKLRVAAATLFAMPGTPFVYYGEEIGMLGGAGAADENKRTPFRWDGTAPGFGFTTGSAWRAGDELEGVNAAAQQADPGSIWTLYRNLIALRSSRGALHSGTATRPVFTGGGTGVMAVLRTSPAGPRVLYVANFAATASGPVTVTVAEGGSPSLLFAEGLTGSPSAAAGTLTIPDLAARGFAFVALD